MKFFKWLWAWLQKIRIGPSHAVDTYGFPDPELDRLAGSDEKEKSSF